MELGISTVDLRESPTVVCAPPSIHANVTLSRAPPISQDSLETQLHAKRELADHMILSQQKLIPVSDAEEKNTCILSFLLPHTQHNHVIHGPLSG